MKAVRLNQWGQPYQVEDVPQPTPTNDEVLVRVHAASLNPVDSFVAAGYLQSMLSIPMTAGADFAGEVVSVGAEVTHLKPGDAVYGMIPMRGGAFAEYAAPKAHEVAHKPQSLDYVQAAAVPLPALAAWQTLFDLSQVQSGERVLIHGAGGNVGSFAAQLAKNTGAYVIANDQPERAAFLQGLGVDQIVNGKPFEEVVGEVDVVLNYASADLAEHSYNVLKHGGRYATTVEQQPSQEEAERRGIRTFAAFVQPTVDHLTSLAQVIDAGKLNVFVNRTFPVHEAQSALEYRQNGATPGKIVLTVN